MCKTIPYDIPWIMGRPMGFRDWDPNAYLESLEPFCYFLQCTEIRLASPSINSSKQTQKQLQNSAEVHFPLLIDSVCFQMGIVQWFRVKR